MRAFGRGEGKVIALTRSPHRMMRPAQRMRASELDRDENSAIMVSASMREFPPAPHQSSCFFGYWLPAPRRELIVRSPASRRIMSFAKAHPFSACPELGAPPTRKDHVARC